MADDPQSSANEPWFATWFDGDYLRVYAHRNDDDAAAVVDLLARFAPPPPTRLLDLGCGNGRHLARLRAMGYRAFGLDLSATLLGEANSLGAIAGAVVRADMRAIPIASGRVEIVVSLFTSFGYFDDLDNRRVLSEIARVLSPGGCFLLDYANRQPTIDNLVARSERRVDHLEVSERRWWDPLSERLEKEIEIRSAHGVRRIRESVHLYHPDELVDRLQQAGLQPSARFGDASGVAFDPTSSRRQLILATKG